MDEGEAILIIVQHNCIIFRCHSFHLVFNAFEAGLSALYTVFRPAVGKAIIMPLKVSV